MCGETIYDPPTPPPPTKASILYLDDRPVVGLVEQLDDGGDAVVFPHSILRHFSLLVPGGQVAQSANSRFAHILFLAGAQYGVDQRLYAVALDDQGFIVGVVAREVGQDSCGAGQHVDVVRTEQAHQHLQQTVHPLLETARQEFRKVPHRFTSEKITQVCLVLWTQTSLVAASDKFLRVHRQFSISRWLEPVRCLPRACIPPAGNRELRPLRRSTTSLRLHCPVSSHGVGTPSEEPPAHRQNTGLRTGLDNGRFVAGTHREDFEHTACGPQQLLVAVVSHDVD